MHFFFLDIWGYGKFFVNMVKSDWELLGLSCATFNLVTSVGLP